ncbi:SIR2 family protein [Nocardioides ungokensis]
MFADVVGGDYDYYAATAAGDPARVATLIAEALHERWWTTDEFAATKEKFEGRKLSTRDSALKAEVASYFGDRLGDLTDDEALVAEMCLLRDAVVDGIITTNYDPLLEHLFPDYEVFVGEEDLLFSDIQGVGEIYKVHGDHNDPDSLILTAADYERFTERKPYLAAKLLTIFVERPIVFLGYSLSDENVLEILRSIATALTRDRVGDLQNRLIFVEWDPAADEHPQLTGTVIPVDGGFSIPVQHVRVRDFVEVFSALGELERRFPARYLRHLKEHVYELVRDQDPQGRLFVADLDPGADLDEVDIVLGVGAISKVTESYKGKTRFDLLNDVVNNSGLAASRVVEEALPTIPSHHTAPVYKYLREAGHLNDDGTIKDPSVLNERIVQRVARGVDAFQPPPGYKRRADAAAQAAGDFAGLVAQNDPGDVVMYVARLPEDKQDPEALRTFLAEHKQELLVDGHALDQTQWCKAVCLYDWLVYGKA